MRRREGGSWGSSDNSTNPTDTDEEEDEEQVETGIKSGKSPQLLRKAATVIN